MGAVAIGVEAPSGSSAPVSGRSSVHARAGLDAEALAELMTAPPDVIAERARRALWPVLPHNALVLVTLGSPAFPVQIAGARRTYKRLAAIDWTQVIGGDVPIESRVARLELPGCLGGLHVAGWVARSAGFTVAMIVGDRARLNPTPGQEHAAIGVVTRAAARLRAVDNDPPPGMLALSRAMSHERERVRLELRTRYAGTLSSLLHILRSAADTSGSGSTPPGLAKAIDMASSALLDLQGETHAGNGSGLVSIGAAFGEVENEVGGILRVAGIRLVADLDADRADQLAYAVTQAARLITRAAVLDTTERAGADKLRLRWQLTDQELVMTIADNGSGFDDPVERLDRELAGIRRLAGELRGRVDLDRNPHWGTTLTCHLPLHHLAAEPDTAAVRHRLADLRKREREVLELMMTGLRNRDISARLFISERTVKFHISNILAKLQVGTRSEAVALVHGAGPSLVSANTGP
jgi:DNA-binding CsgD family transcriptional regulator